MNVIVKYYEGSNTRRITPSTLDSSNVMGDDNAVRLQFKFPKSYQAPEWSKIIEWDCLVDFEDGSRKRPFYPLDMDDGFNVPREISLQPNGEKGIKYNLLLRNESEGIVERSLQATMVFHNSAMATEQGQKIPDEWLGIIDKVVVNGDYKEKDGKPHIMLYKQTNGAVDISLNMPYLNSIGFVEEMFIDKKYKTKLFIISDKNQLPSLEAQEKDLAIVKVGDRYTELYLCVATNQWHLVESDQTQIQISDIYEKINDINTTIGNINNNISGINTNISGLSTDISNINLKVDSEVTARTDADTQLQNNIDLKLSKTGGIASYTSMPDDLQVRNIIYSDDEPTTAVLDGDVWIDNKADGATASSAKGVEFYDLPSKFVAQIPTLKQGDLVSIRILGQLVENANGENPKGSLFSKSIDCNSVLSVSDGTVNMLGTGMDFLAYRTESGTKMDTYSAPLWVLHVVGDCYMIGSDYISPINEIELRDELINNTLINQNGDIVAFMYFQANIQRV